MKKVIAFVMQGCPYCRAAKQAYDELIKEPQYTQINVEWIDENEHPERVKGHDYYYCPSFFVDEEKTYEAHPSDDNEYIRSMVEETLRAALE